MTTCVLLPAPTSRYQEFQAIVQSTPLYDKYCLPATQKGEDVGKALT